MKEIKAPDIARTVSKLFQEACYHLPEDVLTSLKEAREREESPLARKVLDQILENADISAREKIPLCQDTGSAIVFLELGQEVRITEGELYTAINQGVAEGYTKGYLRKSMVDRPFSVRANTQDNTPAIIHTEMVPGDKLRIIALPKGGGGENMSRLGMLSPASDGQEIIDFVVKAVDEAGSNPCPPTILGIGIGGTAEKAMILAKKALLRKVGKPHPNEEVARLEREILRQVNALGIGPMGYGGRITTLAVHVETFPVHITSLPVAVNFQCHSARRKEAIL